VWPGRTSKVGRRMNPRVSLRAVLRTAALALPPTYGVEPGMVDGLQDAPTAKCLTSSRKTLSRHRDAADQPETSEHGTSQL